VQALDVLLAIASQVDVDAIVNRYEAVKAARS
jgi:hypothetical protein